MSRCTNAVASAAGPVERAAVGVEQQRPDPSEGVRWRRSIQSIIRARPRRPTGLSK